MKSTNNTQMSKSPDWQHSGSKNSRATNFAALVVTHPVAFLMLSLLLFVVTAMGNAHYRNTLNYQFFFSADNPQLAAFEKLQDDYAKTEAVFIALAPADGNVFTPENLQRLESFTKQAWQTPHSLRVDSMVNFQHTEGNEEGLNVYGLFEHAAQLTQGQINQRKQIALSEPSLVNALVAADASVAGVRITIAMPGANLEKETPEVVFFVRELASRYEAEYPGLKIYLTGQIVVDQAFPESTEADFGFVWPAFLVVMMLLLALIYRSAVYMLITIVTGILAIGAGMGAVGWTALQVNAAVTAAPVMILTLAMADCIHILASYTHQLTKGDSRREAMIESLRVNLFPVFLTSFMTMVGFLTLHFNDSPPYRALGYVVASGVVFALIFSLIFLPAAIMLLPHKTPAISGKNTDSQSLFMWRLGEWVVNKHRWLLAFSGTAALFLSLSASLNHINDNPVRYFGESQQMRQHLEFVNQRITGLGTLNYSLGSGAENGIADPQYLQKVDDFALWLKAQPEVIQVDTLADVIKRINKSLHNDDPAYYRIPEDRESVAQYLLLYELSLPLGMDIGNMLTYDKSASRVRVAMTNTEGRYHIELDQAAQQWLQTHTPESMWAEGASAPLMFAHIGKRSIDGMLGGLIGSLFVMSFILIWVLRSRLLGVLSLVSNIIPVAMAFGYWGWIDGNVDLGITVTFGIAFGIVVDDTIHFLSKYQRARKELGKSTDEAIKYAFSTVGVALLVTSAVLIAGFAMLGFSAMNITSHMAILTTVTIAFAFIVDFFLLPPLLVWLDREKVTKHV
ncbi:MAG: MMPL family transporter [Hahellaceae bacterium]|nr:MMPL family transporter [Hahellaceae bacterium]MCP5211450.1 MMPL family transporter [Hahellaceae bacterium]